MYSMLTRSQRISHENLRLRDRGWLEGFERWFDQRAGLRINSQADPQPAIPPMFTPYTVRGVTLKNRVVVSPMAQYSCIDGVPGEFHLVHLGRTRARRRRDGGGRDDLHLARCPHHPGLPRAVERSPARCLETHRRFRSPRKHRPHRPPDRPCRGQSIDQCALARRRGRPPAGRGQLAGAGGIGSAIFRRRRPGAAGDDARRYGPGARTTSSAARVLLPMPASIGWSCIARMATCCRASSRR